MDCLTSLNARLSRWAMYVAVACLLGIVAVVVGSVIWRYLLNDAPAWSEPAALILVINVAMFGAAAGVRDAGHIGMESLVGLLPKDWQLRIGNLVGLISIVFGIALTWGCAMMAASVWPNSIPTLGISEAWRYIPGIISGALIILFSIEHLIASALGKEVTPSWH